FLYPASTRYTDVDYPARVSVDRWRFPVVVILRQQPSLDTAESAALDVRSGILVSVAVSALDFEIVGPFHQSISVPRDADSTPAVFYLRPLAVGRAHFTLEFVQSGQHLGTIVGEIDVVAADENGAMNNSIMQAVEISAIPSEPTLILAIDHGWENGQHILTFSLFS